ncbi:DNA topoisomerase I, partial [Candidatus Peregrinibacteria bacterium]|nr:DNA topoisomerase I [Candidatus Peregrinibacteria bacterium]
MSSNLVIVESPTKAKTISRFLDKSYTVIASMGHIRDLPKSKIGIDTENNFTPTYTIPVDKKKIVSQIKDYLKSAQTLWIATDEDREGEAIGWHLIQALEIKPGAIPIKR